MGARKAAWQDEKRSKKMSVSRISNAFLAVITVLALGACASTGATAPVTDSAASSVDVAPAAPVFFQKDIMKKTAADLDETLGEAALVRREGKGEFRRYEMAKCELIVILYPAEDGLMTATHLDAAAKTSEEAKPDLDACLAGGLPRQEGVGT